MDRNDLQKGTLYRGDAKQEERCCIRECEPVRQSREKRLRMLHNTMRVDGSIVECPNPERSADKGET